MFMTKTSVNKIPFEGPKTHNGILAKIRTDIYAYGTGVSVKTVGFIVSSFFRKAILFKDFGTSKVLYYYMWGRFFPAIKKNPIKEQERILRLKRKRALQYLTMTHRAAHQFKIEKVVKKYNKWCKKREEQGLDYATFDIYLIMYELKLPDYIPVSKEAIEGILFRFNDQGKVVVRKGTRAHITMMVQNRAKIKAEKELLNQH